MWDAIPVEIAHRRFRIEVNHIVLFGKGVSRPAAGIIAPHYLVFEIVGAKYRIHQDFQIVVRGRVAVKINRTGRFENTVHLHQTNAHHRQIRHHRSLF